VIAIPQTRLVLFLGLILLTALALSACAGTRRDANARDEPHAGPAGVRSQRRRAYDAHQCHRAVHRPAHRARRGWRHGDVEQRRRRRLLPRQRRWLDRRGGGGGRDVHVVGGRPRYLPLPRRRDQRASRHDRGQSWRGDYAGLLRWPAHRDLLRRLVRALAAGPRAATNSVLANLLLPQRALVRSRQAHS
jgi:hypothetical protein